MCLDDCVHLCYTIHHFICEMSVGKILKVCFFYRLIYHVCVACMLCVCVYMYFSIGPLFFPLQIC